MNDEENKGEKRKIDELVSQLISEVPGTDKKRKVEVPITAPAITEENKEEICRKVLKQIHFYFSDSNMNDKFLRGKISEDKDGFIDLSVITSFNRMKALCVDIPFIANLLKEKSTKVIVEGTRIKRATPWPLVDNSLEKTVHASNIPPQWDIDQIESFFEKYGTVNRVNMIKKKGNFEGSVFIEFDTIEEAKKSVEAKPMLEGKIVEIQPKKEKKDKNEKKEDKKKDKKGKEKEKKPEAVIRYSGVDPETNFNALKEVFKTYGNPWVMYENKKDHGFLKFRSLEEAQEYLKKITEVNPDFSGKKLTFQLLESEELQKFQEEEKKKEEGPQDRGAIKYSGIDPESNFNAIKDIFKTYGNPWVVYENKQDHGFLKFRTLEEAQEYLKKITEANPDFSGKKLTYQLLEGEEEKKFFEQQEKAKQNKGKKGKQGRGNNKRKK